MVDLSGMTIGELVKEIRSEPWDVVNSLAMTELLDRYELIERLLKKVVSAGEGRIDSIAAVENNRENRYLLTCHFTNEEITKAEANLISVLLDWYPPFE